MFVEYEVHFPIITVCPGERKSDAFQAAAGAFTLFQQLFLEEEEFDVHVHWNDDGEQHLEVVTLNQE
jgi:hypothetical protein